MVNKRTYARSTNQRVQRLFQCGESKALAFRTWLAGLTAAAALYLDGSFTGGDQAMTPKHNPVTEGTTPRRTTLPC